MTGVNSFNDVSSGSTSPSGCDAERARQGAQYNPTTARAPLPREETNPGYTGGYNNQPFRGYYGPYNRQCYAAYMITGSVAVGQHPDRRPSKLERTAR